MKLPTYPWMRRRKFLVNHQLQLRLLLLFLLQMSVIMTVLGFLVHSHVTQTAEVAMRMPVTDALRRMAMQQEVIDNVHGFYLRSLGLMALTVTMLVGFGLLASHKIAGPVVNLGRFLDTMATGDYSKRISFRRKDNLDDFARHVNSMAESIEDRRARAREIATELVRRCEQLDSGLSRREFLHDAQRLIGEYKEVL